MTSLNRIVFAGVPKSVYDELCRIAESRRITVSSLVSSFIDRELRIYKELNPAGADNNK